MLNYFLTANAFLKLINYTFYYSVVLLTAYLNHILISLSFYVREIAVLSFINFHLAKYIPIIFGITYSMLVILSLMLIWFKYRLKTLTYLLDYENVIMKISIFTAVTLAIVNILISIFCFTKEGNLLYGTEKGLKGGIEDYNSNQKSKEVMDRIQMRFQCCGINSYKDWFRNEWYEKKRNSEEMDILRNISITNEHIPYSCCSDELYRPCIHHFLRSEKHLYEYEYLGGIANTLWTEGCVEKISKNYLSEFHTVNVSNLVVMALCLIQFVFDRIIQTADSTFFVNGHLQGWIIYHDLSPEKEDHMLLKRKYDSDNEKHKKRNPFVQKKKRASKIRRSVQFDDVVQAFPGSEEQSGNSSRKVDLKLE